MKFNEGFLAQLREATKLLQSEGPMAATAAIQRALHGDADRADPPHTGWTAFQPQTPSTGHDIGAGAGARPKRWHKPGRWAMHDVEDAEIKEDHGASERTGTAGGGRFIAASCTSHAGTRAYKLYVPGGYRGEPLPLVVMLHGCTQNPDDFAAGTGMNQLAEEHNCFVAYPEQNQASNATRCWNWFQAGHQQRDQGEPSILAAITRDISTNYKVDSERIYIAGLSAGGAMAAVMAATYPELYAAVGIHSGLPYGVAHDMPSAFAAMKRGRAKAASLQARAGKPRALAARVPTIVFHGDADATVHPENADLVLTQCAPAGVTGQADVQKASVQNGHAYTRTIIRDAQGKPVAEKWIVHGAGHAWSGGSRQGTYTDPAGPGAAREMMRFFSEHRRVPATRN